MAELTVEQAIAIVEQAEQQRLKKNAALKAWRKEHRAEYNEYIRNWHKARRAKVAEAAALLLAVTAENEETK